MANTDLPTTCPNPKCGRSLKDHEAVTSKQVFWGNVVDRPDGNVVFNEQLLSFEVFCSSCNTRVYGRRLYFPARKGVR